jgi:hypothetical protein
MIASDFGYAFNGTVRDGNTHGEWLRISAVWQRVADSQSQ